VAPERLDSLSAIEAALWRELSAAPHDPRHPWRTPVLASTDGEIFSDARAAKLAQLDAHPIGTLVHWSASLQWQLRLRVQVEAHTDGLLVSSHWARLKLSPAANDYLSLQAPGSALANALGARGEREHFALLVASVLSVDWLELHPEGHRRARFAAGQAAWLQA
jgi:pyridoxamine 5'-phosphate oxidase